MLLEKTVGVPGAYPACWRHIPKDSRAATKTTSAKTKGTTYRRRLLSNRPARSLAAASFPFFSPLLLPSCLWPPAPSCRAARVLVLVGAAPSRARLPIPVARHLFGSPTAPRLPPRPRQATLRLAPHRIANSLACPADLTRIFARSASMAAGSLNRNEAIRAERFPALFARSAIPLPGWTVPLRLCFPQRFTQPTHPCPVKGRSAKG
mmetsp:Transcript_7211/g.18435  ORF Transcript_7211/g.18435 Transcript_7211/m.18435 type:complete len:207 (+) Transcript_7211:1700-2320(+)